MYRGLGDLRRDFDEMFSRLMTAWPVLKTELKLLEKEAFVPAIDGWMDTGTKSLYLHNSVPGTYPEDVKFAPRGDKLMILAECKFAETSKEVSHLHLEFAYGCFERVLPLPKGVEVEKLTVEIRNGVPGMTVPIAAAALPRWIEITPVLKKVA